MTDEDSKTGSVAHFLMSDAHLVPQPRTPELERMVDHFFDIAPLQMRICESPCSFYLTTCQEPPKESVTPFPQPALPCPAGRSVNIQGDQGHILEGLGIGMSSKAVTKSTNLGAKNKRKEDYGWNQNLPPVKKKAVSHEHCGTSKRKDKDELKVKVGELKKKLSSFQEKVWKTFGQNEGQNMRMASENLCTDNMGQNRNPGPGVEELKTTLWWECAELSRGEVHDEPLLGENEHQQFAQLLKAKLRNTMARVVDRVLTICTETSGPELLSSSPVVSFVNDKRGILEDETKRLWEVYGKKCITPRQSNQQTESAAFQTRPTEPSLFGHLTNSSSFHSHAPFPSPYQPHQHLQSMEASPLLHYSMQQLYSRTVSRGHSARNLQVDRERLAELEQPYSSTVLPPLVGFPESTGPDPVPGWGNGRRAGVGVHGERGAMDLHLSASGSQDGLSPCHLKKAKVMFFYTRYPSVNTPKNNFPDVKGGGTCKRRQTAAGWTRHKAESHFKLALQQK